MKQSKYSNEMMRHKSVHSPKFVYIAIQIFFPSYATHRKGYHHDFS